MRNRFCLVDLLFVPPLGGDSGRPRREVFDMRQGCHR